MVTAAFAQKAVDWVINKYKTSEILVLKYSPGSVDRFGQSRPDFSAGISVVGRAIHNPTKEMLTVIGDGERFEIAFLFSRLELLRKLSSESEGKWITTYDRIQWNGNVYVLEEVRPTGQLDITFSLVVALGKTLDGERL